MAVSIVDGEELSVENLILFVRIDFAYVGRLVELSWSCFVALVLAFCFSFLDIMSCNQLDRPVSAVDPKP